MFRTIWYEQKYSQLYPTSREYEQPSPERFRKYTDKLTERDVLRAFDDETTAEAPMLTASEITDAVTEHFDIEVSSETVRRRLREMEDSELVASKEFGASAVGWTALVGPRLSDDVLSDIEATDGELERGETRSHDELFENEY